MNNTLTTLRAALSALEMQQTGLQWYRGMMPEYVDGSDDEADAETSSAITDLRTLIASMEPQPAASPVMLKVVRGDICCKSLDMDQSYGMWVPVTYSAEHGFVDGTCFYTHPAQPSEPKAGPAGMGNPMSEAVCESEPSESLTNDQMREIFFRSISPGWTRRDDETIRQCFSMMRLARGLEGATQPKSEPAHDDLTIAYMSGFHDGKTAKAGPVQEPTWLLETTKALAKSMAKTFYPEVPQWQCLDDLAGVISQIDNMTTGLMREPEPVQEPVKFLADGTRFKVTLTQRDCKLTNLPRELGGRWVAMVAAENDCHLAAAPQARKPLTDDMICDLLKKGNPDDEEARLIRMGWDAAHGIEGGAA